MRNPKNIHQELIVGGLLVLAVCLCGATVQGLEVVFKKEVTVNEDTILLKDIAVLSPADDGSAARLGALVVSAAPAPGEVLTLNRPFLQYRLGPAVQAGANGQTVWPENVIVKRTAQSISIEQFEEIFRGYIRKNAPWKASEIFFARISTPGIITLPQGRLAVEVQERSGQGYLGHVFLTAQVNVNGKTVRTISLSGEVLLQKEVIRAAHKIDRGAVITKEDLTLALEKIKDVRPESNPRWEDIVGKRATRHIQSGQILTVAMMQDIPMVQKGKQVVIRADNGLITVTTLGIAQENGQQGDQVKVINVGSGKEILATVVNPGMVTVHF
ncbi:MAG: flagellar basal body P-ring formation protein FlgA [Desulfobacteraceae bacterium]|nr:MAG: flagellar basal body P-ring formation protein FlgA [Desulfobacteraceae bacterium]